MPLKATPGMYPLPFTAVKPEGWLNRQFELTVSGFFGHVQNISRFLTEDNGWLKYSKTLDEFRSGENRASCCYSAFAWEEQAYWLRGAYRLALITGDPELKAVTDRYIGAMLDSARDDGWFGPVILKNIEPWHEIPVPDIWPHMVMTEVLLDYYDATGDRRALDTLTAFCGFCLNIDDSVFMPTDPELLQSGWFGRIQSDRCCEPVASLIRLYELTGDETPLRLSERMFAAFRRIPPEALDRHVVNFCQRIKYPATNYLISGDRKLLEECESHYLEHMALWGQMPGGLYASDENTREGKHDPRQATETCAMNEIVRSFLEIGRITCDPRYADRTEDIMFNSYPASHTPDYTGFHYLTADNQPLLDADDHDHSNGGMQTRYDPFSYRCCQHNTGTAWPNFLQSLFLTDGDTLVAWAYSPCRAETRLAGGKVTVHEVTGYPFSDTVVFELESEKTVSFRFRVPGWTENVTVSVNGVPVSCSLKEHMVTLRGLCGSNRITVVFPQEIKKRFFPLNGNCVCIDRGPLTYSLRIREKWVEADRHTDRTGREWKCWDVLSDSPFNYALDIRRPVSVAFQSDKAEDQPFTSGGAPVILHASGRRVAEWKMGEKNTVMPVPVSPVAPDSPEETLELVPLGCQRVRISCFPWIG